ncbi:MAG: TSUP family transporter [bacterium]
MTNVLIYIAIGLIAGLVMGMVGVGGGAIIIFALLFMAHLPQKMAQGTTLLIVAAPVSLLAAYNYYTKGFVHLKAAIVIMVSFLIFSFIGSQFATILPNEVLKFMLGIMLILMGIKILFF